MDKKSFFIEADELKEVLEVKNDSRVILAIDRHDIRFEGDKHIPGAYYMDSESIGGYDDYIFSPDECANVFKKLGINQDTELILYSSATRVACKVAFVAYWLGLDHIKILNGGINAWLQNDYAYEVNLKQARPVESFFIGRDMRPDILVSTPDDLIVTMNTIENAVVVSARNWEEYTGQTMGHDWNKGVGEIYGAKFIDYNGLIDKNQFLIHPSNYISEWSKQGIRKDKTIIFYCGTAWRSSLAFFVAKDLGWQHVKMFDGSWLKWYEAHQNNPEKYPIQIGNPAILLD